MKNHYATKNFVKCKWVILTELDVLCTYHLPIHNDQQVNILSNLLVVLLNIPTLHKRCKINFRFSTLLLLEFLGQFTYQLISTKLHVNWSYYRKKQPLLATNGVHHPYSNKWFNAIIDSCNSKHLIRQLFFLFQHWIPKSSGKLIFFDQKCTKKIVFVCFVAWLIIHYFWMTQKDISNDKHSSTLVNYTKTNFRKNIVHFLELKKRRKIQRFLISVHFAWLRSSTEHTRTGMTHSLNFYPKHLQTMRIHFHLPKETFNWMDNGFTYVNNSCPMLPKSFQTKFILTVT